MSEGQPKPRRKNGYKAKDGTIIVKEDQPRCEESRKVPYATRKSVLTAINRHGKRGRRKEESKLGFYKCPFCRNFHLTSEEARNAGFIAQERSKHWERFHSIKAHQRERNKLGRAEDD